MTVTARTTLLALKAVSVMPGLRNSDRQILGGIIEHFNRKTGQCDPSVSRQAGLSRFTTRTVYRSLNRLEGMNLVERTTHGGHLGRNSYRPNWARLLEEAKRWDLRLRDRTNTYVAHNEQPEGHKSHLPSDNNVTQTYHNNLQKEVGGKAGKCIGVFGRGDGRGWEVAQRAAESRWSNDLNDWFARDPESYGAVITAIDNRIRHGATMAEHRARGGGLAFILAELRKTPWGDVTWCHATGPSTGWRLAGRSHRETSLV